MPFGTPAITSLRPRRGHDGGFEDPMSERVYLAREVRMAPNDTVRCEKSFDEDVIHLLKDAFVEIVTMLTLANAALAHHEV